MNQSQKIITNRQNKLLKLIREKGSILVPDASQILGVSEITVRRDLSALEKKYAVERFHGGARSKTAPPEHDILIQEKEIKKEYEKDLIGQMAASLISDYSTIFLNSGTTTLSVLKNLGYKHINVFTNNAFAPTCPFGKNTEVVLCGGECRHRSRSLIGPFAESVINSVYADVCILGTNGLTAEHGATTAIYHEAKIHRLMVQQCQGKIIVVADGSKIGKFFNFVSLPLREIDILITDSSANKDALDKLYANDIEIHIVN